MTYATTKIITPAPRTDPMLPPRTTIITAEGSKTGELLLAAAKVMGIEPGSPKWIPRIIHKALIFYLVENARRKDSDA